VGSPICFRPLQAAPTFFFSAVPRLVYYIKGRSYNPSRHDSLFFVYLFSTGFSHWASRVCPQKKDVLRRVPFSFPIANCFSPQFLLFHLFRSRCCFILFRRISKKSREVDLLPPVPRAFYDPFLFTAFSSPPDPSAKNPRRCLAAFLEEQLQHSALSPPILTSILLLSLRFWFPNCFAACPILEYFRLSVLSR